MNIIQNLRTYAYQVSIFCEVIILGINFLVGRAGRYKSKFPVGEVTCLDADDLPLLHSSLDSPSPVLEVIGLRLN